MPPKKKSKTTSIVPPPGSYVIQAHHGTMTSDIIGGAYAVDERREPSNAEFLSTYAKILKVRPGFSLLSHDQRKLDRLAKRVEAAKAAAYHRSRAEQYLLEKMHKLEDWRYQHTTAPLATGEAAPVEEEYAAEITVKPK